MRPRFLVIILMASFFIFPGYGQAKSSPTSDQWSHLTELTTDLSQAVDQKDTTASLTFVQDFLKTWTKLQKSDAANLTDTDSRTMTTSLDTLKMDLNNQEDPVKLKRDVVQLSLVVDALSTDGTPMWISMSDQVMSALNNVQTDLEANKDEAFQVDLNKFLDLYQMIYPAMVINVSPQKVNRIEGTVLVMTNNRMTYIQNRSQNIGQLHALESDLKSVFKVRSQSVNALPDESLHSMMLAMGGLIGLVLLYVSWKKYRGGVTPTN
ncbi:sporulation protein YpjB [Pullulanibacillus sp. KACC 23026]|uniref:sporulation protein YpjB n=1 Tax=Pullulanibacillus sp. KACC 23026 TaxID=3028315 RepID=UPI0023AFAD3C|nr:sporulation protein YpjB [Pullulanibacillus sp. KACC 23026]WEG11344.1 sporulation protein YpjB [Pullulanibacillus sp. KACC 23026]